MSFDRKGFSHSREVLFVLLRRLCFESSNWKFEIQGDRAKFNDKRRYSYNKGGTFDVYFRTVCTLYLFT